MAVSQNKLPESSLVDESLFPSNSKTKPAKSDDIPNPEHKMDKVIKGTVTTRKHNMATDMSNRFIKFTRTTILPAVKDAAVDMAKRWLDVMVYGDERPRSRSSSVGESRQYVSYSGYYQQNNRNNRSARSDFDYISGILDDQVFERKSDAEEVLRRLKDELLKYRDGEVSVADFFDSIGKTTPFTANKYGWVNLDDAYVTRVSDGWLIEFPEPEPLR